ncbi:MAG: NAD(P)-dependent oxidoreductase, partial [Acidimicrobiia bacterium]|nr:NAD(P)-dependent oxidoreductase [Acidimicrobiia bacterium]
MSPSPSVLVIGAGSIGSRHTRNLLAAGAAVSVADPDGGRLAQLVALGAAAADLGSL